MKKALVLIAIAAMFIGIIPLTDSSEAVGETTISGYLYEGSKDISMASYIYIGIIYSDDGTTGTMVGSTNSVSPWTALSKTNKFSITITPQANLQKEKYYIYFNIYGFSVTSLPSTYTKESIEVDSVKYACYQLPDEGSITVGTDNPLNTSTSDLFIMKTSEGTVSGKVSTGTDEPIYLNGVIVTLYDLKTKTELKSVTTHDGGLYTITYNTGTYGISYELGGYKTEKAEVTISEEIPTVNNVSLKETQSYFGLDLPHALMILGGATAVVLLLFTLFMRMRLSRR